MAVCELYPNVELWGGCETSTGFFYEFRCPHSVHAHLIEEKMRQIVKTRQPIRTLEMVAFSAKELLKSQGHVARAAEVEEGLVEVIQIGSFHDLSPGPHLQNTAELVAFKISLEPLADYGMRLVGWCHGSKLELKKFLKRLNQYTEPAVLGEKMGLWKGSIWLPTGLEMRRHLICFLKEEWFKNGFEISVPPDEDRVQAHRLMGKPKVCEIWQSGFQETHLQLSFFDLAEGELTSCLHSIAKTLTILGFDHSIQPVGLGGDYVVEDGIGRRHSVFRVNRISKKGSDFYITVEIEKMMALLLEKNLMMVEFENQ
jgi:hypothetical protein